MADTNAQLNVTANMDGLMDALKTAKSAIDNTFDLKHISSAERAKPVGDLFRTLEQSSDRAISSMIRGTRTWQSALLGIATNMEIRFAQLAARKAINWMQSELLMTAATQTGTAARTASEEAGSSEGLATKAGHAITSILNSAKEVFAGIFAFLSPMMGPAAVGPAAAGSATVASLAGGIPAYEAGSWHIPGDSLAFLHAGEMVVPKPFADSLRQSGGIGGGDSYSITINAIDTQTGAKFLKNNAASIASAISGQVRNFNSAVPAWKG